MFGGKHLIALFMLARQKWAWDVVNVPGSINCIVVRDRSNCPASTCRTQNKPFRHEHSLTVSS
jgi:hypothetical protein